jgi:hypothetical protein
VDFKPRHVAVRCCQTGVPNGVPFLVERRKAFNSVSVSSSDPNSYGTPASEANQSLWGCS